MHDISYLGGSKQKNFWRKDRAPGGYHQAYSNSCLQEYLYFVPWFQALKFVLAGVGLWPSLLLLGCFLALVVAFCSSWECPVYTVHSLLSNTNLFTEQKKKKVEDFYNGNDLYALLFKDVLAQWDVFGTGKNYFPDTAIWGSPRALVQERKN